MTTDQDTRETSSFRPFLLEAIYKWHVANEIEPIHLLVDCSELRPGLLIPADATHHISHEKELLLDITPDAVDHLQFGSFIRLTCYFDAGPQVLQIPVSCVLALFCPLLPGCGLFFIEVDEEENQAEIKILREEERKSLQTESSDEQGKLTIKDNALSRSKLKIVRPSPQDSETSKK